MPRLKTRRSSSSSTWRPSQSNTGGRSQASQSSSAPQPRPGARGSRFPSIPPPVTCANACARAAQPADVVEVEPRRREQIGPVVVLELEHAPDEREPVRVHAGRGQADDDVARAHGGAVDHAVAVDDPDAGRGEVELALAIDARQLGGLAADQRHPGRAAHLGRALDELRDLLEVELVRGDVVEQDQRVGAAGDHVVDAVRGHVGAAGAQRARACGRRSASSRSSPSTRRAAGGRRVDGARRRRRNRARRSTRRRRAAARRSPPPSRARPRRRRTSGLRSRRECTTCSGRPASEPPRSVTRVTRDCPW